jgi:hypothetical protein
LRQYDLVNMDTNEEGASDATGASEKIKVVV